MGKSWAGLIKKNISGEVEANYVNSTAHEETEGSKESGASFTFGALSSNDEQHRKFGKRKWNRAARNKVRKVVSNGIGEQEKKVVYKKRGSGDEGNNERTKKVRDSNVVLCSGVGMSRLSAEIGDFSQSRREQ